MPEERRTTAELFSWIDEALSSGDADRVFERLIERLKEDKRYGSVFSARLMRTRLALGLPLTSQPAIADVPKELQPRYQDSSLQAAREVGRLYLADGDIPGAWPYFRAAGEIGPIRDALEALDDTNASASPERIDRLIQIAFQDGAHPKKGFALVLKHYGMCRAITTFSLYAQPEGREESLGLLVRALHAEIVENLTRAIAAAEGTTPSGQSIPELLEGRAWLFENHTQYTDSSHLAGLLKFCMDLDEDDMALRLAVEMADYARRLSPMFQHSDDPPFDRAYEDRYIYLKALAGEDVERAVAHFEAKVVASDPERDGGAPAEVLVRLLSRLGRYREAIQAFQRYLGDSPPEGLSCPTLPQLCEMAGDFDLLKRVAREQSDALSYLAAMIRDHSRPGGTQ